MFVRKYDIILKTAYVHSDEWDFDIVGIASVFLDNVSLTS